MNSLEFKTKMNSLQKKKDEEYEDLVRSAKKCDTVIRDKFWTYFKNMSIIKIRDPEFYFVDDHCSEFRDKVTRVVYYNDDHRCKNVLGVINNLLDNKIKTTDGETIATVTFEYTLAYEYAFKAKISILQEKK